MSDTMASRTFTRPARSLQRNGVAATGTQSGMPRTLREADQLLHLLSTQQLDMHFQPILDLQKREFIGHEALVRGPVDTPWATPGELFALAQRTGLNESLEVACLRTALELFSQRRPGGKLFVNLSADTLYASDTALALLHRIESRHRLTADRIVIEISENQRIGSYEAFHDMLSNYRRQGYSFAIDDLGEGFSNLRRWSELRPEYVKIDRHFISGIDRDAVKFRLVRAMIEIAEACQSTLIAEGIETSAEFITLRDLGVHCGQGYFIARPAPMPPLVPNAETMQHLNSGTIAIFPQSAGLPRERTIGALLQEAAAASPHDDNEIIYSRFEANDQLQAIPVIDSLQRPIGMINRHRLIERFARPYQRELYARRSCTQFMDKSPLICDRSTPIHEVGKRLGAGQRHHLNDGVIVTDNGVYLGVAETGDIMARITELQIQAARYANPLTQLPGNVPINEHIDRLLDCNEPFVACHVDIDNFKPYNDIYGYRRGDEVIKFVGRLLGECADPALDFIGHIGGDDYVILFQSLDWQTRCHEILTRFDREIADFLEAEDIARKSFLSEDRQGRMISQRLPSLSIGSVCISAGMTATHNEISAAMASAKKEAKKQSGSFLFQERRRADGRT